MKNYLVSKGSYFIYKTWLLTCRLLHCTINNMKNIDFFVRIMQILKYMVHIPYKRLHIFIFIIKLFCRSIWWNVLSFIPICLLLGYNPHWKSNSSYCILVSFTDLSPLILNSPVHSMQFLYPKSMGYMKSLILISVNYNILNKISKIKYVGFPITLSIILTWSAT